MTQDRGKMVRSICSGVLLVFLAAAFVGCGGGSSSSSTSSGSSGSPGGGSTTNNPPPPLPAGASFFSLNINKLSDPWPTQLGVNFGIWRTLGADLIWSQLEPCQPADETDVNDPCYSWNTNTSFDNYMNKAASNGQQVLYTAYYTPTWAVPLADQTDTCAGNLGLGGCHAPVDVESGDNHWKNFLTALYTHVNNNGWHIKYWECWNEPNISIEYNGSLADLNQLCQDLHDTIHALDATAQFTTPAPTGLQLVTNWMQQWVSNGYANYADIIAFHGYICNKGTNPCPFAEAVTVGVVQPLQGVLAGTSAATKPLWDTEGGYPTQVGELPPADMHAAFVARFLLLQQSAGVATVSYFGWDYDNIALINDPGSSTATLNLAGVAWQQIYNWTVGAKYTSACQNTSGTIWQCGLTLNGTSYLIVWDTSQTCSSGQCTTSAFAVPSGFTQFDDLAGNTNQAIANGTVQIGAKPLRLH
ncbi:MAG: hypothetical protein ACLP6G_01115 [Terriglobales bacterium]